MILFFRKYAGLFYVLMVVFFIVGCAEKPILWDVSNKEQVISKFIENDPDQYSEFGKLLEYAGLTNLMSVRGPYTLFLPSNDVMKAYYKEKGVNSLEELDRKDLKALAYNHLLTFEIQTGDIGLGALRDTNALGDYLVTEFQGSDIIINKQSKIIKRDIQVANGYIHLIDKVIDPVVLSVFDKLLADPSYSLFSEGLKRTGIKDTLQIIRFPFGKKSARTRFTILAVPDTVYNRYGIKNIDDLISYFTDHSDSIKYLNNGFYRYMEYHCLCETYYLSSFANGRKLYPVLSYDNNVSLTIDTDYKLNHNIKENQYTAFDIPNSNVPAKNGAIHSIGDLLPVLQPEPSVFTFYCTDYFDLKQGDYYGKYYMKWFDGSYETGPFAKIHWEGDYMQYYYKESVDNGDTHDCLNMNGFWWIEIITPKIMKGRYNLTAHLWSGNVDYKVYVDGVHTASILSTDPTRTTSWGEFNWEKTEEHRIKVQNTTWGLLFWNTVIFTPIK